MSDSHATKGRSIPLWQRGETSSEPLAATPSDGPGPDPSSSSFQEDPQRDSQPHPHTSRASLLNQATKFLQDDDIRDAPIERKTAFLESKGLTILEVEKLLAVSPSEDASSDDRKKQPPKSVQVSRVTLDLTHVLKPSYRPIESDRHKMRA